MRHHRSDSFYVFIFLITLMGTHIALHLENYDIIFGWIVATGFYGVFVSNGMRITKGSLSLYFLGTQGFAVAIRATMHEETRVLGLLGVILSVVALMCFVQSVFGTDTIEHIAEILVCGVFSAMFAVPIQLFGALTGPLVAVFSVVILLVVWFVWSCGPFVDVVIFLVVALVVLLLVAGFMWGGLLFVFLARSEYAHTP
jgi:hypothetical protein